MEAPLIEQADKGIEISGTDRMAQRIAEVLIDLAANNLMVSHVQLSSEVLDEGTGMDLKVFKARLVPVNENVQRAMYSEP